MTYPSRVAPSVRAQAKAVTVSLLSVLLLSSCSDTPQDRLLAPKSLNLSALVEPTRQARLTVVLPASEAGPVVASSADFGPATYGTSGPVVEVSGLACEPLPMNTVPGAIALIQRGTCVFVLKAFNAQNAGYAGVLIYNNIPGDMPRLAGTGGPDPIITIPVQGITQDAGLALRNQIRGGNQVVVSMLGFMGADGENPPRLAVLSPPNLAGPTPSTGAAFGPTVYGLTGPLVDVGGLACGPLPMNTVPGAIALAERGVCNFTVKAINAQNAGYAGILIYNNATVGPMPTLGGSDPNVVIPAQGIERPVGLAFLNELHSGNQVIVAMFGYPDQTPPTVQVPDDMIVDATSAAGATVTFVVTAIDDRGPATATCVPPSGSLFAIGTRTVTCTATDLAGNTGTASFLITVLGATGQSLNLAQTVKSFSLDEGTEHSLVTKLEGAAAAFDQGNTEAGCGKLNAFSNEVRAQNGKKISPAEAETLDAAIARIRAVAGC